MSFYMIDSHYFKLIVHRCCTIATHKHHISSINLDWVLLRLHLKPWTSKLLSHFTLKLSCSPQSLHKIHVLYLNLICSIKLACHLFGWMQDGKCQRHTMLQTWKKNCVKYNIFLQFLCVLVFLVCENQFGSFLFSCLNWVPLSSKKDFYNNIT